MNRKAGKIKRKTQMRVEKQHAQEIESLQKEIDRLLALNHELYAEQQGWSETMRIWESILAGLLMLYGADMSNPTVIRRDFVTEMLDGYRVNVMVDMENDTYRLAYDKKY